MTNTKRFFDALETLVEIGGDQGQDDIEREVKDMSEKVFQEFTLDVAEVCAQLGYFLRNGIICRPHAKKRETSRVAR
jgi:hypothetical protein